MKKGTPLTVKYTRERLERSLPAKYLKSRGKLYIIEFENGLKKAVRGRPCKTVLETNFMACLSFQELEELEK